MTTTSRHSAAEAVAATLTPADLAVIPWRAYPRVLLHYSVRAVLERIAEPFNVPVYFIVGIPAGYASATHAQQERAREIAATAVAATPDAPTNPAVHTNPFNVVGFVTMGGPEQRGAVWIDPHPLVTGVVKGYDGDTDVFSAVVLLHEIAHAVCGPDEDDTIVWEGPMAEVAWEGLDAEADLLDCLTSTAPALPGRLTADVAAMLKDVARGAMQGTPPRPAALPHYWSDVLAAYWERCIAERNQNATVSP